MESRIARLDEVEEPRKEWAAAVQHRRRAALQLGGGDPQRRRRRAQGDFTLGPGVPAGQRGGADRHHRAQRRRQVHAAPAAARRASSPTPGRASLGASVAVGEIDQARGRLAEAPAARRRRSRRVVPELAPGRRTHPAREVRAQGATRSPAGRRTALARVSAPAPRWRCCRPAA